MDEWHPDTQTAGALIPPPRVPPTAIATSAPLPPRSPRSRHTTRSERVPDLIKRALDQLDSIADRIAETVGLR